MDGIKTKADAVQLAVEAGPQYWREDPDAYATEEARLLWLMDTVLDLCADAGIEVDRETLREELIYYT